MALIRLERSRIQGCSLLENEEQWLSLHSLYFWNHRYTKGYSTWPGRNYSCTL